MFMQSVPHDEHLVFPTVPRALISEAHLAKIEALEMFWVDAERILLPLHLQRRVMPLEAGIRTKASSGNNCVWTSHVAKKLTVSPIHWLLHHWVIHLWEILVNLLSSGSKVKKFFWHK